MGVAAYPCEVKEKIPNNQIESFHVDDYGAIPNDGKDDVHAINSAIEKAKKVGGGIIKFSKGKYHIS